VCVGGIQNEEEEEEEAYDSQSRETAKMRRIRQ
jgi:hypothetical protein